MFNSITSVCVSSVFAEWGTPAFFTIEYSEGLPRPYANQMHFHTANIFITFACLSIPVFFAGYLWRKPKCETEAAVGADTSNVR